MLGHIEILLKLSLAQSNVNCFQAEVVVLLSDSWRTQFTSLLDIHKGIYRNMWPICYLLCIGSMKCSSTYQKLNQVIVGHLTHVSSLGTQVPSRLKTGTSQVTSQDRPCQVKWQVTMSNVICKGICIVNLHNLWMLFNISILLPK